jgi:hypothetical protein
MPHPLYPDLQATLGPDENNKLCWQWRNKMGIIQFSTPLMTIIDAWEEYIIEQGGNNELKTLLYEFCNIIEALETDESNELRKPKGGKMESRG